MRKVSYLPLWHLLLERGMTKSQIRIEAGLTTNVLANITKGSTFLWNRSYGYVMRWTVN